MRRRFLSTDKRPVRYMTVEPLENGVYLSFGRDGLYYSIDDSDWVSLPSDTNTPSINVGQTIKIKGINVKTDSMHNHFSINGRCKLSGTIMSIIYGDKPYEEKIPFNSCFLGAFFNCASIVSVAPDFLPATTLTEYCYEYMFYGCTGLTTAPALPATTLTNYCYSSMFEGCSSLTTAPALPATTLAANCYYMMFFGCTSLTTAPELPATALTTYCYYYMFCGCSKLNYIKMLATDISASNCLGYWVSNVASTGTFVKNPNASLPTGASGIPSGWTVVNDGEDVVQKTVNHGVITTSTSYFNFNLTFEYPVASNFKVLCGDANFVLSAGSTTSNWAIGPGESLGSTVSFDPSNEDDIYIYEITIE